MSPGQWSDLSGWTADETRPGFLKDPTRPGWARTADGRWWSQSDIDRARVVVDEVGAVLRLEFDRVDVQQQVRVDVQQQVRLEATPADRAANVKSAWKAEVEEFKRSRSQWTP